LYKSVIGKTNGAEGYGAYIYAISLVGVLSMIALLGMDKLLVREVASFVTHRKWNKLKGIVSRANQLVFATSVAVCAIAYLVARSIEQSADKAMVSAFLVAIILLPLTTLMHVRKSIMQGLQRFLSSQVADFLIQPLIMFLLVVIVYFNLEPSLSSNYAVLLYVVATSFAFIVGSYLLFRSMPTEVKQISPYFNTRQWMTSAMPMLLISGCTIINSYADIVMLSTIVGAREAGIYAICTKIAGLITFVLFAVNTAFSPILAKIYAQRDMRKLQNGVTKSAVAALIGSLPIAICIMVFGQLILKVFGPEFVDGYSALLILSVGQLINCAAGSVAVILTMTKYERDAAFGIAIASIVNVVLNSTLIPIWGMEGAAVATASSMILWNALLIWFVWNCLRIQSTALPLWNKARGDV
jgi:O-antigen/teichoic acid export membrane protein